jgi:phosphate transport system substrate-binding protein
MRTPRIATLFVCTGLALTGACKRSTEGGGPAGANTITVAGSTSVQPFAEKWAEAYSKTHPALQVNVQGGGSTAGIKAAQTGAAQIGTVSRELKPEEQGGLQPIVVARDGIAIVVNPASPVGDLTLAQVKAIFTGQTRSWKELGGPDKPITVITREEGSGTRGAFEELALEKQKVATTALVQDSTGAVREMVHGDPAAIGYISVGQVNDQIKAVKIAGVEPTEANVVAKRYPLVRPFLFVTKAAPVGATKEFIDFVLSPEGQELVRKEGLIPAK